MAASAKDSKILEYKDLISQLNTTISAQTELIRALKQELEADRAEKQILQEKIDYLTQKLFAHPAKRSRMSMVSSACLMKRSRKQRLILSHLPLRFLSIPVSRSEHMKSFLRGSHLVMKSFHFLMMNGSAISVVLL